MICNQDIVIEYMFYPLAGTNINQEFSIGLGDLSDSKDFEGFVIFLSEGRGAKFDSSSSYIVRFSENSVEAVIKEYENTESFNVMKPWLLKYRKELENIYKDYLNVEVNYFETVDELIKECGGTP